MEPTHSSDSRKAIGLSPEEFRRLGHRAVDMLAEHLASLEDGACRAPVPDSIRRGIVDQPLPVLGTDPDALLNDVASRILRYPMGNNSPRFFGWVNSPAAPLAIVGELLAAGLNPSVAGGDHAATYVEHAVLRWIRELLRYAPDAGSILTSGGSVANLIGLAVMRHVRTGGEVRPRGLMNGAPALVIYTSVEGHSCLQKAVELLGIGNTHLRRLPVTPERQMDVRALQAQVADDRRAGLRPACVAATAGTVNTGAIDPLDEVADVCRTEDLWFHVDASYGGPAPGPARGWSARTALRSTRTNGCTCRSNAGAPW
jgi:glutamate/tyrosine decarboxylase-like PLP-dependent enzyme